MAVEGRLTVLARRGVPKPKRIELGVLFDGFMFDRFAFERFTFERFNFSCFFFLQTFFK